MRAFTGAILELQEYIKVYHVTGLTWNPDVSFFLLLLPLSFFHLLSLSLFLLFFPPLLFVFGPTKVWSILDIAL